MKKIRLITLMAIFAFLLTNLQAQDHKSAITVNAGFSLVGGLFDLPDAGNTTGDVSSYSLPAIQVGYDYFILNWFSVGAAGSFQFMGVDYDNYVDENGETVNGTLDIVRSNFAARALFHYFNKGRLDMYSGVRLGLTNWAISDDLSNESYDYNSVVSSTGTNFAPQLILYGLRGYITENIGLNAELAVGAPHFFSAGLNYRF